MVLWQGKWLDMGKEAAIGEIAKELGVSATTVSRALSDKGRIGKDTKERILAYIRENDYVPNVRLQKSGRCRTGNICVVLPGENDFAELPFFQKIMLSICDYFAMRDYNIMVIKTTAGDITELKKVVEKNKADGVILTRAIEDGLTVRYLQEKEIPFVVIGSYDDETVYQADVDQENGCRELTSVLIRMGIRRIALFCADRTHTVTRSRYRGFVKAFRENDLAVDKSLIFDETGYSLAAEKAIEDVLKKQAECVICMDDNICLNVLNKLRKDKVNIPEDIRIASFYNSSLLDGYYPSVSCLEFDTGELGMTASKMLLDTINGNETPGKIVLGYKVILKDSTK